MAVLHYLQSITPSLALGGELVYQKAPTIPGGSLTVLSAAGIYTQGDSTVSGSLSMGGCHLCFHQKASDQVQVGVELEINTRIAECVTTIGYQVDLPKADLVFKGLRSKFSIKYQYLLTMKFYLNFQKIDGNFITQ